MSHYMKLTGQSFRGPKVDLRKGDIVELGAGEEFPFSLNDAARIVDSDHGEWCDEAGEPADPPEESELEAEVEELERIRVAIAEDEELDREGFEYKVLLKASREKVAFLEDQKAQSPETFSDVNEAALTAAKAELEALLEAAPTKAKKKKTTAKRPAKKKAMRRKKTTTRRSSAK